MTSINVEPPEQVKVQVVAPGEIVVSVTQPATIPVVVVESGPPGLRGLKGDTGDPGPIGKFAQDIGNGVATSFVVTHNLNTRDVSVTVYLNSGTFEEVLTDVEMTSVNTVTLRFGAPPTASQYRVVVIG